MQFIYLFTYCFTAQVLKVCRTPGPTDARTLTGVHQLKYIHINT